MTSDAARELLAEPTPDAARRLLGARLIRGGDADVPETRIARIVEVEAYVGTDDLASHARFGPTDRNRVMFGPPGMAYVYLVYGMYHCLNVVTEPAGRAGAVLIRAAEPVAGAAAMRAAREASRSGGRSGGSGRSGGTGPGRLPDARLATGPGVLCVALSITRSDTGRDLLDPASPLRLELAETPLPDDRIVTGPRVGIDYAAEPWRSVAWRFADAASGSVSRPLPGPRRSLGR